MANSVIGQILSIGPTLNLVSKSGTPFSKRSLVISLRRFDPNTGEPVNDYENTPELSFMGDRCRELDQFSIGQNVEVFFDLSGRKYVDQSGVERIINDIRPYKIEAYGRGSAHTASQHQLNPVQTPQYPQPQMPNQGYVEPF